jgi:hypothetical protein
VACPQSLSQCALRRLSSVLSKLPITALNMINEGGILKCSPHADPVPLVASITEALESSEACLKCLKFDVPSFRFCLILGYVH